MKTFDAPKAVANASKLFRRTIKKMQFDSDRLLHRAGLTRYHPAKDALGAIGLIALGGAVGSMISLMLTPRTGPQFRRLLQERARGRVEQAPSPIEMHA